MADAFESAWVEVLPDLQNFRRNANSEMSGILGTAGDEGGRRAGAGVGTGLIGGIGAAAGGVLTAFAALGLTQIVGNAISAGVQYGFQGIDLASDLAETRSAVDQVFGDASSSIQDFAAGANTDLGQTQQQALAAAQTFGVFGQSAGLSGEQLSDFSTGLIGLSSDFASFYNTSPQEAIDAIGAGLRGEAEPLRKFGILLDDATLKSKALELGIYDGNGSLTSQQRILAANAVIFAQSGVAQGDFARTSDSLSNQQKILGASFEEAQTKLGTALLPAMTSFVTFLNEQGVPILNDIIDKVGPQLGDALVASAPAFGDLLTAVAPLLPALVDLAVQALPPVLNFLVAISPLIIDFTKYLSDGQVVIQGLFDLLSGDTSLLQTGQNFLNLKSAAGQALGGFAQAVGQVIGKLVLFSASVALNIGQGIDVIKGLPGQAVAALGNLGNRLFQSGKDLISGFINGIKAMVRPVADAVNNVMAGVANFFPHSPAKTGPFSGSGWTAVQQAGAALFGQFNTGFASGQLSTPGFTPSAVYGSVAPTSGSFTAANGGAQISLAGATFVATVDGRPFSMMIGEQIAAADASSSLSGLAGKQVR